MRPCPPWLRPSQSRLPGRWSRPPRRSARPDARLWGAPRCCASIASTSTAAACTPRAWRSCPPICSAVRLAMTGCCRTPTSSYWPPPPGPASTRPPDRAQPASATGDSSRADQRSDTGVDRLHAVAETVVAGRKQVRLLLCMTAAVCWLHYWREGVVSSHTTTPSPEVPVASQRPSGLNATAPTPNISWLRVWSCSPLRASQIRVVPKELVASQRPSALNATACSPMSWLRVWSCSPLRVSQIHVASLELAASQRPSGPNASTSTPFRDSMPWVKVWSCVPLLVSQIRVVLPVLVASQRPSRLNATACTPPVWVRVWSCVPLLVSQIRAVLSWLPVASQRPSGLNATALTGSLGRSDVEGFRIVRTRSRDQSVAGCSCARGDASLAVPAAAGGPAAVVSVGAAGAAVEAAAAGELAAGGVGATSKMRPSGARRYSTGVAHSTSLTSE